FPGLPGKRAFIAHPTAGGNLRGWRVSCAGDRPPAHCDAARVQALHQPPARTALPVRAQLLRIRDAGHRTARATARRLARHPPHRPLPSTEPRRLRPGPGTSPALLPRTPLMPSTLIVNARLVNEGRQTEGDLRIEDGRIARIGSLQARAGEEVVDARGRWLLPGMIDDQV